MKVTITIEDNTDSNEVTLTSIFSEGLVQEANNSTAACLGMKLLAYTTELTRERKKAPVVLPPRLPLLRL